MFPKESVCFLIFDISSWKLFYLHSCLFHMINLLCSLRHIHVHTYLPKWIEIKIKIFTLNKLCWNLSILEFLSYKTKVRSPNFVAFSEYMNFAVHWLRKTEIGSKQKTLCDTMSDFVLHATVDSCYHGVRGRSQTTLTRQGRKMVQKCLLFVNTHTIENVNAAG